VGELCSVRRAAHGNEGSELRRGSCFAGVGANRGAKQVGKFIGSCGCAVRISVVGEIGAALAFGGRSSPASTANHSFGALEVSSNIGGLGAFALLGNSVGNKLAIFAILVFESRRAQVIKADWAADTFVGIDGAASLLRDFNVSQAC